MPPISFQKEPLARRSASRHRYTPPVNYYSTITDTLLLVASLLASRSSQLEDFVESDVLGVWKDERAEPGKREKKGSSNAHHAEGKEQ